MDVFNDDNSVKECVMEHIDRERGIEGEREQQRLFRNNWLVLSLSLKTINCYASHIHTRTDTKVYTQSTDTTV